MASTDYFVIICVAPRRTVLIPLVADILLSEAKRMNADGSWILRSMTVMPDHAHIFFTLGQRLTLSQAIARLKAKTKLLVRSQGSDWQDNYYDRKVRPEDLIEQIVRYIFLNPFQAGLLAQGATWPFYYCCATDWEWFKGRTDNKEPFPEWLQ